MRELRSAAFLHKLVPADLSVHERSTPVWRVSPLPSLAKTSMSAAT